MVSILSIWWQVEESSLKPMESVEEITKAVQLDKAKVESIKSSPSRVQKQQCRVRKCSSDVFRLKSLWLPRLREERTTGRW